MISSKTFECITECNSDCTFEKHFKKVIFINQGVTIWCSNDAFSLAKSESHHALGQFWAWGQFRFVRTEPSSNSILKSISGRLRVNSIRTWIDNIETELYSPSFFLEKWIFWKIVIFKTNFQAKWVFNRWEISERELSKEKIDKEGIKNAQVKIHTPPNGQRGFIFILAVCDWTIENWKIWWSKKFKIRNRTKSVFRCEPRWWSSLVERNYW